MIAKETGRMREFYQRHREDVLFIAISGVLNSKKGLLGGSVVLAFIFCAILAQLISPYDPLEMRPDERIKPPCAEFLFGTDMFGRDIFSRVIWGSRISIMVGLISVSISLLLSLPLGVTAGYYGGKIDEIIMRMMDVILSFPSLVFALIIISVLGPGINKLMVVLGAMFTPAFTRLIRGNVLSIKEKTYVDAARALGDSTFHIIANDILPNSFAPIVVISTLRLATAILSEAALSFLGLGVRPPTPAWGYMLQEARGYVETAPWMTIFPGMAIVILVLSINLLGDTLRDVLDPRLRID